MRHIVTLMLILAFAAPAPAQIQVLIQPTPAKSDDAEEIEKSVRSVLDDLTGFDVVSERDVKRQLDRLNLSAEDLGDTQWRQLAGRMDADYVFRLSEASVVIVDPRGGDLFTAAGTSPDDVVLALEGQLEPLRRYGISLLFCASYSEAGEHSDALRNCEQAVESFPASSEAQAMLAKTLVRAGRCTEAVAILEELTSSSEEIAAEDIDLAFARQCAGDTQGALEGALAFVSTEDSLAIARTIGQAPSSIESTYDRFDDQTTYFTPWYRARLEPDMRYSARVTCPGTERCSPSVVQLLFKSHSGDWEFLRDRRLVILVGEERIEIEELAWIGDVEGPGVTEVLGAALTVPQVTSIANAARAEARLGGHEFVFGKGARDGLAILLQGD